MNIYNATRKLTRHGWRCTSEGTPFWTFKQGNAQITIGCNPADESGNRRVATINARHAGDRDEIYSDYHAGTFCRSVASAMRLCADMGWTWQAVPVTA